jgi:EAL domain-containing protein (putative c-di-GMP-specific phosphodiesterase class I)
VKKTVRYLPIDTLPFQIGRSQDIALSLPCNTVSNLHAQSDACLKMGFELGQGFLYGRPAIEHHPHS